MRASMIKTFNRVGCSTGVRFNPLSAGIQFQFEILCSAFVVFRPLW